MYYGYTRLATDWSDEDLNDWKAKIIHVMLFFVPEDNPDNEKYLPQVDRWLLEVDEEGVPVREIGLDVNNKPLFRAPDDHNFGFWTDSLSTFEEDELEPVDMAAFNNTWDSFNVRA